MISVSRRTAASGRFPFRRTFSVILCLRFWCRRRLRYLSTPTVTAAEAAGISFCTLLLCFPLIAISLFSSQTNFPFSSLYHDSCFHSFVSGLKISFLDLFDLQGLFTMVVHSQYCLEFRIRIFYKLFRICIIFTCSSCAKVFVDQMRNLSSTEKSALHLCLLFLQTDFLHESMGLVVIFNLRIKHLRFRESITSN